MARHHLTLAALATSALPGLDVVGAQPFTGGGDGDFDAALVTTADGAHLVVRTASSPEAATRLAAERRALAALTAGARSRLPFAVVQVHGSAATGRGTGPVVVTSYLAGRRVRPAEVHPGGSLAVSIGEALAAVHALPTGVAADALLPTRNGADARRGVTELVERAAATEEVPEALLARWRAAAADAALWQFPVTVVHGSMSADVLLSAPRGAVDERVVGVLAWSELGVGDPARDLAWVLGLPSEEAATAVFAAYGRARRGADADLRRRATLYAELEIARWLLHGVETEQLAVVADASRMLDALLESVEQDTAGSVTHERERGLTVHEVERMLDDRRLALAATGPVRTPARAPVHEAVHGARDDVHDGATEDYGRTFASTPFQSARSSSSE